MKILLTNDDGIYADGLFALYKELKSLGKVVIVAPLTEQSATGHGITLSSPLRVKKVEREEGFSGYAVSGTPADCVKIALRVLMDSMPDIVVSGINQGPNVGLSVIYSGTVSAAVEGTIIGVPSIAVSLTSHEADDFSYAAKFAKKLAITTHQNGLPSGTLLNVNVPTVPEAEIKGVKITKQGNSRVAEVLHKRTDPSERTYFWLSGELVEVEDTDESDLAVTKKNYVSITPLHYDLTDYKFMEKLSQWKIKK
ncbi:MAG: 5'/3'-nucleotidase SurE [Candidatus Ancaeobacter aquaticus]|nr:5'/3'-nucleotidase SurE [Candidatus Ancaeobacter aquaticus]